jgi:hypothetical protein
MSPVLIKEKKPSATVEAGHLSGEAMAFCPVCKEFQTLWFTNGKLMQIRKFSQRDGKVYHDCGSDEPCRLYRTF